MQGCEGVEGTRRDERRVKSGLRNVRGVVVKKVDSADHSTGRRVTGASLPLARGFWLGTRSWTPRGAESVRRRRIGFQATCGLGARNG